MRFETPAGRQGQVDFATFTLPWGRRHALVTVLSHSRLLWLRFYQRQTMEVLIEGLESAFGWFGGVPQELLFDQMRSVVLSDGRAGGGELVLNADFLRFAAHWGFGRAGGACRPYRARTKGKVERPIRYLRESFFYGRKFISDEDLNEQSAVVARGNRQRAPSRHHRGAPGGSLRTRRATSAAAAGKRSLPASWHPQSSATGPAPHARYRRRRAPPAQRLRGGRVVRAAEAGNRRDRLREMLADLKMPGALEAVDGILAQADGGAVSAAEAIEQLLDA